MPLIDPNRTYFWLLSLLNKHIRRYNEKELVMQMKGTAKNPQMKLLHTTRYNSSHVSAPFRRDGGRGRSSSPSNRKSTRSPGGRERSLSPWGTKRRSLSRTPRGTRKPGISRDRFRGARPRKGRSPSAAFSSGGTYKFTPRSGNRLDKYKTKDVCHLWQNTGSCKYGNACKFAHARPATPAKIAHDDTWHGDGGWHDDPWGASYDDWGSCDVRDFADDNTETFGAYPFKGRGKGKGKGKGGKKREGRYVKGVRPCRYWVNGHCKTGNDCPDTHEERFRSTQRAAAATQDTTADTAAEQATPTTEDLPPESFPAAPFSKGRERTKGRGKVKAKVRRADIDKRRLVWHEFLHQPLIALT